MILKGNENELAISFHFLLLHFQNLPLHFSRSSHFSTPPVVTVSRHSSLHPRYDDRPRYHVLVTPRYQNVLVTMETSLRSILVPWIPRYAIPLVTSVLVTLVTRTASLPSLHV